MLAAGVAAHLEADQRGLRRGPHQEGCSAGGGIDEAHHHLDRAHRAIGLQHPRLRVHRDACSSRIARTSGIAAIARGADSGHRERGGQDQGDHAQEPHDDGPAAGRQDRLTRSTRDRHGPSDGRGLGGRTGESSDLRHLPALAVHGDGRGRGGRTGESSDLRHLLALAVQGDARLREGGLDQLADRARRRYAELVPHGVAVAVELEQGTAEVAAAKMGADRQLTCPLQERIEVAGRARCVDREFQVTCLERLSSDPFQRLDPQLLEAFALGQHPVVVPVGKQLLPHQLTQQCPGLALGDRVLGRGRGTAHLVHVDLDVSVQPDAEAVGLQQAGTALLRLENGTTQAGQRSGVRALGPQAAGDVQAAALPGEAEQGRETLLAMTQADVLAVGHQLPPTQQTQAAALRPDPALLWHLCLPRP